MPTSCWSSRTSTTITSRRQTSLDGLEAALGYTFSDKNLLIRALTHKSIGADNNERLEFLGDAVLGYVIAKRLFATRPGDGEDVLTMMRASVVKGETLAEAAADVGIAEYLRLGLGERRSGGHQRASILANALEAIIGAVHEDGGIEPAEQLVLALLDRRLHALNPAEIKDPKTRLQELLQGAGLALPEYSVVSTRGSDHEQVFSVCCKVEAFGLELLGEGNSRRNAEKQAAQAMLLEMEGRV